MNKNTSLVSLNLHTRGAIWALWNKNTPYPQHDHFIFTKLKFKIENHLTS